MKQATLSVRMDEGTRKALENKAEKMNIPLGALIRQALELYCRSENPGNESNSGDTRLGKNIAPNDHKTLRPGINASSSDGLKIGTLRKDPPNDGRPIYRLARDWMYGPWTLGPYECKLLICRNVSCAWEQRQGATATVKVHIFNYFPDKTDASGNKAQMVTTGINSDTWDGKRLCHASTYEEALANMDIEKKEVEKRLRCHFDLSALAFADDIRRLFANRLANV